MTRRLAGLGQLLKDLLGCSSDKKVCYVVAVTGRLARLWN